MTTPKPGRRTRAIALASMGSAAIALTHPGVASATHGQFPKADNSDHVFAQFSLTTNGQTAYDWGTDVLADHVNVWYSAQNSGEDVKVYDSSYGQTGWAGQASCVNNVNWNPLLCDTWTVKFNESTMPNDSSTWKSLGCHEFGHTVGLGHRSALDDSDINSCMRTDDYWPQYYDAHDADQISA